MKCPHCLKEYFSNVKNLAQVEVRHEAWLVVYEACPACENPIFKLAQIRHGGNPNREYLVYPRAISRSPLSTDVPDKFAGDYREACLVIADSPKASAALSRRCLQHVLREKGGAKKRDLFDQIDEVMPDLPSDLGGMIDTVRVMGNFAAHPLKSTNTGEIIDVEPGEAEWLLETLEMLFDHYFVKPAEIQRRRDAIDQKLKDAGKPPLK